MAASRPDTDMPLAVEKDSRYASMRSSADIASSSTRAPDKPASTKSHHRNSKLFWRSKKSEDLALATDQSNNEKTGDHSPPVEQFKAVSILQLFRYVEHYCRLIFFFNSLIWSIFRFSTTTEIILNLIGLACASAAGASQVSIVFLRVFVIYTHR